MQLQEVMMEVEDPIESLPGGDFGPNGQGGAGAGLMNFGQVNGVALKLTEAGVRALLGRKHERSKPYLELKCKGCGRTTWSKCKFLPSSYLEPGAQTAEFNDWVSDCYCSGRVLSSVSVSGFFTARWSPAYYKLTQGMKNLGITEPQPTGAYLRYELNRLYLVG